MRSRCERICRPILVRRSGCGSRSSASTRQSSRCACHQPVRADLPADLGAPLRLRVAQLGVDQAVQQVCLPPVMPAAEPSVAPGRRPGHHAELGTGQRPQPFQMPPCDGGFRADRPVDPYLIHQCVPRRLAASPIRRIGALLAPHRQVVGIASYDPVRAWAGPSGGSGETTGRTAEKSLGSESKLSASAVREVTSADPALPDACDRWLARNAGYADPGVPPCGRTRRQGGGTLMGEEFANTCQRLRRQQRGRVRGRRDESQLAARVSYFSPLSR